MSVTTDRSARRGGARRSSARAAYDVLDWVPIARFVLLLFFLLLCLLFGGGSRDDIAGIAVVQPAAVLLTVASFMLPGKLEMRPFAPILWFLAALAAVMAMQLIPLPPGLWTSLPGRGAFAGAAEAAGLAQPWRPISLTPDLTLGSLVSLTVPTAVVLMMAGIDTARRQTLLPYILGAALVSALVGVVQIAGGPQSGLYMYKITNYGAAVGFFSNRNHQATLLVMAIPMLALWARKSVRDPRHRLFRRGIAAGAALALLPMLAVTGSRTGILLAIVAILAGWLIFATGRRDTKGGAPWRRFGLPVGICVAVLIVLFMLSRTEGMERLVSMSVLEDQRVRYLPVTTRILWDFFPFGSGFGSFDPIFRVYEPEAYLRIQHFNHAHNDLLELGITAGLFGYAVLLGFLIWALPRAVTSFAAKADETRRAVFASLGAVMIFLLFASSIADYPLRTPLMAAMLAIACAWLAEGPAFAGFRQGFWLRESALRKPT